jgi:hypothetical protein
MSSFPKEFTFLETYKKTQTNEGGSHIIEKYKKEIRYLEQELNYWITENGMSPSETKEKRIQDLIVELKNVKETYENILKSK